MLKPGSEKLRLGLKAGKLPRDIVFNDLPQAQRYNPFHLLVMGSNQ